MSRNRWVQLVSLLVAAACLVGASILVPVINSQRSELIDNEVISRVPPKYTLTAAMLGSFRGLFVNMLWYQAEMDKRENNLFDAKAKRDLIVTLQPRFPQVWRYQAWDMAYNISVATHTPQERWDWVNKGIRLLREEGIPYNPESVELYRELAWIFFHKVGQYSDDMHWYYKSELAREWQELLGAPTEGATTDQVIAEFAPIADAAEAYLAFDRPSREARERIASLMESKPAAAEDLQELLEMPLPRYVRQLTRLRNAYRESDRSLTEALTSLQVTAEARLARAAQDPLSLFLEESPEVRPIVQELRALGQGVDTGTLRRMGRVRMLERYLGTARLQQAASQLLEPKEEALVGLMTNPEKAEALAELLAFMRARALITDYHMDPVAMLELMQGYGPVDWRHPAAHGAFWAHLGIEKAGKVRDRSKIDWLNTTRQRIHALQELTRYGRVSYDPISQRINLLPDPRFIEMYDRAMEEAIRLSSEYHWQGDGNVDSFEAGHENFLQHAVLYHYLYGDIEEARAYLDKVRNLYGSKPHNAYSGEYRLALEDFVITQLQRDWGMTSMAPAFVDGMFQQAFQLGLANGDLEIFNRFVGIARVVHQKYQKERSAATPTAPRERMLMLPFDQALAESYAAMMRLPSLPLLEKARIYYYTPPQLQLAAYPQFREVVVQQAAAEGIDPARAFPTPPGMDDQPVALQEPGADNQALDTIERK